MFSWYCNSRRINDVYIPNSITKIGEQAFLNVECNSTGTTNNHFIQKYVTYSTHIQNIGWQEKTYDGRMSGTSGKSLRLEGIQIGLDNQRYSGDIEYRTHIQNIGWEKSYRETIKCLELVEDH